MVKTKIQSDPKKFNEGMLKATGTIVKEEGPGALLAGLGPTVVGYGIEGAVKVRERGVDFPYTSYLPHVYIFAPSR